MGLMGLYHDISLLNWDLQTHVQLEAIHHSATLSSCAAPCLRPLRRTGMGSCSPRCDTTHLWSNCGRFMALLYSHKKRFVEKGYPKSEQSELLKKTAKKACFDSQIRCSKKIERCHASRRGMGGTSHGYFGRYDTLLSHHYGAKHTKIADVILQVESSGMVDWL